MSQGTQFGGRVRRLRRREGLTQKQLAIRLGISPSYLNLIEKNRRPLSAPLLIKLAQLFQLDLQTFAADDDSRLGADLLEVLSDPLFDEAGLIADDVRDFVAHSPALARAMRSLYDAYRDLRSANDERALGAGGTAGLDASMQPSEEVSDLIQHHMNYFPELEEVAEQFRRDAGLEGYERFSSMRRWLETRHGVRVLVVPFAEPGGAVRRFDPERRVLTLSELLPPRSRHFQVAHQVALLEHGAVLDRINNDERLTTPESRALARVGLANYFAGAVLMPYGPFLEAARAGRWDIELLGHRFRTSYEQVTHRMTTMRRPGAEGIPLHMLRIDIAGNISKRFSGSGIRIARYSGACPRWNVHASFLTPGQIRSQVSQMPDGTAYFCVARTISRSSGGYHSPRALHAIGLGCERRFAREMVYADGVDLDDASAAVPVGMTCRLCERTDCSQRAFPALNQPLRIEENVRGINFYAPVEQ